MRGVLDDMKITSDGKEDGGIKGSGLSSFIQSWVVSEVGLQFGEILSSESHQQYYYLYFPKILIDSLKIYHTYTGINSPFPVEKY